VPFVITPPRRRAHAVLALAGATAALALGAAPAQAAELDGDVCTTPSFSQIFLPWKDKHDYTLSPGGDFEGDLSDWTLTDGAQVAEGNESFHVGGEADTRSLELAAGAEALSAPMCIDKTYPSFRFFARDAGAESSALEVEVLWWESGARKHSKVKLDKKAGDSWAPVKSVRLPAGLLETSELEPLLRHRNRGRVAGRRRLRGSVGAPLTAP
jgi:hypothetical protein